MNIRAFAILVILGVGAIVSAFAQETSAVFRPIVLWGDNVSKGVLLISPTEMLIVDSKGDKCGKVVAKEAIYGAYISLDGEKLAYTTANGLWLAKIKNGENYLVASGYLDFFRWNSDGLGFLFSMDERGKDAPSSISNIKFFWADGDGKNIKQVYP
ncbi:MAG: hypothetical protein Q7R35_03245 [Elusimicrobiota bacterium]|nr:hypothetical protein [Elusimicrobiota bacterium]